MINALPSLAHVAHRLSEPENAVTFVQGFTKSRIDCCQLVIIIIEVVVLDSIQISPPGALSLSVCVFVLLSVPLSVWSL